MSYDEIQGALEVRASTLEDIDVVFENVGYEPTTGKPYLRTRFMPIDRRMAHVGVMEDGRPAYQKYEGVFQLLLHLPSSEGRKPTNDMVAQVIDRFEAATDLNLNNVYLTIKQVERMRGINDGGWYKTPVNVSWYSYAK